MYYLLQRTGMDARSRIETFTLIPFPWVEWLCTLFIKTRKRSCDIIYCLRMGS